MTPAELAAAREFRATRRLALAGQHALGPDLVVPVFTKFIRHACKNGASVALELKEHYVFSPEMVVHSADGRVRGIAFVDDGAGQAWLSPEGFSTDVLPARRFGWIWTQGKCAACGMTALSNTGRLVDPQVRPPAEHAITG